MAKSNIRRSKKPRGMRRRRYGKRVYRKRGNQPEWASLSESIETGTDLVGTIYNNNDIQLAAFPRAAAVAQGYQYFRITKLRFQYRPLLDTFPSTGNTVVPYLYWVINKNGTEYPALNVDWFLANGAKPIRFDEKTVTITYAPGVSLDVLEAQTPAATQQPNMVKVSPWLNTTKDAYLTQGFAPSQVSHAGHYLLVDAPLSALQMSYSVTLTAEFQFKKPNSAIPPDAQVSTVVKKHVGV